MTRTKRIAMPLAGLPRLYLEEMKGLARGRFGFAGAAVVALALGLLAILLSGEGDGTTGFHVLAYGILPLLFGPLAASSIASPRANRFVEALFTAPVTRGRWLTAKLLALLTVGAAYLVLTLPFIGVAHLTIGVHDDTWAFLLMGACGIVFAIALGLFAGVSFPGRSAAAPASLAGGALVLSFFAIPVLSTALQAALPSEGLIRVLHLSPHVLAMEAVQLPFDPYQPTPAHPERSALAFGLVVAGLLALAYRAFLRDQGIDAWEASPARRAALALAATMLLLSPVAVASAKYDPADEVDRIHLPFPNGAAPTAAAHVARPGESAALVDFGDFWAGMGRGDRSLEANRENARDLLVALPVPAGVALLDVEVRLEGTNGLAVAENAVWRAARIEGEPATFPGGTAGQAIRVPVSLLPDDARGYTSNFYGLQVNLTYRAEGNETLREGAAFIPVHAEISGAALRLGLAALPGFAIPATAAIARRLRTR